MELVVRTRTELGTQRLGALLGSHLEQGDLVALIGELGSGKTTLVKGIALGMGVPSKTYVRSPTFVLLNTYQGRHPLLHLDLYRINDPRQLDELDYREMFYGKGVTVVEWAENARGYLPLEHLKVCMAHRDEETREVRLVPCGGRYESLLHACVRELQVGRASGSCVDGTVVLIAYTEQ